MTEKEGIAMLNQIANKLLKIPGDQRKKWFCNTCNRRVSKLFAGVHKRHGHEVRKL